MYMSRPDALLTADEYERLPDEPGYRVELSYGMLVREPQPGAIHGRVTDRLANAMRNFATKHDLGEVTSHCGYLISRGPDCVRGPDVAFIRKSRIPADPPRSFWPFAPDLAIEVASPGNTLAELQQKVIEYFDGGTQEVWIIEPKTQTALIYRSAHDVTLLHVVDQLSGGDLLPGFSISLAELLKW